ncbi:MAG TPA: PAS domain S-box protein [Marmoricola sp.]
MNLPTIVVVDDAPEVRAVLRTFFQFSGELDVVGEGSDGADAVELAGLHRPSLMLLDVSMPGMDGLEALTQVRRASPETRVVMYSGFDQAGLATRTAQLGASAFIQKSGSFDDLVAELLAILDVERAQPVPPTATRGAEPQSALSTDAERILQEHLERFGEVFADAAIGMGTLTLAGRLVRSNRQLAQLLGRSADSLVGTAYGELTGGDSSAFEVALDTVLRGSEDVAQVEHRVSGAGDGRRLLATLSPVRDSEQRPLYVFLQVQDVTRQRAAEKGLRQSEQRFRLLVDAVEDYAIFMLDPTGHVTTWNAGAQRVKGYTADEIIGEHFRVFYPLERQAEGHPERELERALQAGRYAEEGWRIRKSGTGFMANVTITAMYDDEGTHVGFAKVTRDVTERRRADQKLRLSEQRFRLLVDAVEDYAIFMLDPTGHVTTWNAGAQRTKGYTAEEIIGQHFRVFYPAERQAEGHPEHELERALKEGHYQEEGWRVRKDGTRFWADVTITAVHDDDGAHVGFAKVTRDTTRQFLQRQDQERSAATLAAAYEQLDAAHHDLARTAEDQAALLSRTAHELRSPVGVLSMSAELLRQHGAEMPDDDRDRVLAGMSANVNRLQQVLADLVTVSAIEADTLVLHPDVIQLKEELAVPVRTAQEKVPEPEIEVDVDVAPGLRVLADRERLFQIVENLLLNAARHGAPPVKVQAVAADDGVRIIVRDSGAGVPQTVRPRLFERFVTGGPGGSGLGLYIVRELARAQGGDATYDADDNSFVVILPLAREKPAVGAAEVDDNEAWPRHT